MSPYPTTRVRPKENNLETNKIAQNRSSVMYKFTLPRVCKDCMQPIKTLAKLKERVPYETKTAPPLTRHYSFLQTTPLLNQSLLCNTYGLVLFTLSH